MESPTNKMCKLYLCNKEASCFKKYKSKKSLRRHVKSKHPISKRPSTPLPSNASTASEQSARVKNGFFDGDPETKYSAESERTVSDSPYTSNTELEKNRFRTIINDFFTYWNDDEMEMRLIDTIVILLIKHSRIAKQNDANYLAATDAYADTMYQMDQLHCHQRTLFNISNKFYANVRKQEGLFEWDSLVIAFTMGHNLLMKYPHLHPDIVDMLLEVFNLASDDLTKLGGWGDFIEYSKQYYIKV